MSLALYRKKRDFGKTPEPRGKLDKTGPRLHFVIQKHAATRLHYDFRLELEGTLKSWAVPKGPSLDPADKRLAVHVEDHPIAYGSFEGTIPEKQYGAGTVVLWDEGTWIPAGDASETYRAGRLKFKLEGKKLRGGWSLVRMNGRGDTGKENWLLIKERDDTARPGQGTLAVDEQPQSVKSGLTIEDLEAKHGTKLNKASSVETASRSSTASIEDSPDVAASTSRVRRNRPVAKPSEKVAARGGKSKRSSAPDAPAVVAGVPISSGERVVYPEAKLTKLDVARYYAAMAEYILPYIEDRPLSLVRCPRGSTGACFYQKHASERDIPGIKVVMIEDGNGLNPYLVANTAKALAGLAQMGTLELHAWGARLPDIETPDTLIMDLDPDPAVPWADVVSAAQLMKKELASFELESYVKTTGGKGLHVVAPLSGRNTWDELREFTQGIAARFERAQPEKFIADMSKKKRKGKIFIDYLRNSRGATAVAPYSLRARPQATVAVPLRWEALKAKLRPDRYTLSTVLAGLGEEAKAWQQYRSTRQSLPRKLGRVASAE